MNQKLETSVTTCPDCGSDVTSENGETYCKSCGIVIEDEKFYWDTAYQGKDDPNIQTETGNDAMHNKGLGSHISYSDKDISGKSIANGKQFERLRKWQDTVQYSSKDLRRRKGFVTVHRLCGQLDFPRSVRSKAARIFKESHNAGLAVGNGLDKVATAAVYIASRQEGILRKRKEWYEVSGLKEKKFNMLISLVQRELNIGFEPSTPIDYVNRIVDEFTLTDEKYSKVVELVKLAEENNIHIGKNPKGIVAAAIYMAVGWLSQVEVAEKVGITVKTLRNRYYDIQEVL